MTRNLYLILILLTSSHFLKAQKAELKQSISSNFSYSRIGYGFNLAYNVSFDQHRFYVGPRLHLHPANLIADLTFSFINGFGGSPIGGVMGYDHLFRLKRSDRFQYFLGFETEFAYLSNRFSYLQVNIQDNGDLSIEERSSIEKPAWAVVPSINLGLQFQWTPSFSIRSHIGLGYLFYELPSEARQFSGSWKHLGHGPSINGRLGVAYHF